jgi:hypothetical protein
MRSSYRSAGHANGEEAAEVTDEIRLEYFRLLGEGTGVYQYWKWLCRSAEGARSRAAFRPQSCKRWRR